MPSTLLRFLSTIAVVTILGPALGTACSASGSHAASADQSSSTRAASTPVTSDGTVAAQLPHDSINARADAGRILGDSSAKVWVVMASDFECPYCKEWHDRFFPTLLKNYVKTGRVRVAFLNMPLSIHPNAVPAAEAAMCASIQDKFWPLHDSLFARQDQWVAMRDPMPALDSLARQVGVNMSEWRPCMSEHLTRPLIQADHDRASKSGAGSTPTFFVDGQRLAGADADLAPVIDAALAKAGKKPAS